MGSREGGKGGVGCSHQVGRSSPGSVRGLAQTGAHEQGHGESGEWGVERVVKGGGGVCALIKSVAHLLDLSEDWLKQALTSKVTVSQRNGE